MKGLAKTAGVWFGWLWAIYWLAAAIYELVTGWGEEAGPLMLLVIVMLFIASLGALLARFITWKASSN